MRKALFLFLASTTLLADPPYFTDNIEGIYLLDIVNREKVVIVPGTLVGCVQGPGSASWSSWECGLDKAEIQLSVGTKTMVLPVDKLNATEYQSDPSQPSVLSYNFGGTYKETLSNGMEIDSYTSVYFDRKGATPNRIQGRINLSNFSAGCSFFAEIKTTP